MYFNLKKTGIEQAVKWSRNPFFRYSKFFQNLFFILTLLSLCFFALKVVELNKLIELAKTIELNDIIVLNKTIELNKLIEVAQTIEPNKIMGLNKIIELKNSFFFSFSERRFTGGIVLFFCLAVLFWQINLFYNSRLKNPPFKYSILQALKNPDDFNLAAFLDLEAAMACYKAVKFCRKNNQSDLKKALFYYLINTANKELNFIFYRGDLDLKKLQGLSKQELEKFKGQTEEAGFEKIILEAVKNANDCRKKSAGIGDILISFAFFDEFFQKFLVQSDFKKEDIVNLVFWFERLEQEKSKRRCWWSHDNLFTRGSIGKSWAAGFSITLDKYAFDMGDKVRKNINREIVGHEKEIEVVERILEKEERKNVLLVGEPGTGRESIIEAIAKRAFLGRSSPSVNYKRILQFEISSLAAEATSQEQAELVLEQCFKEALEAKNIILVINDFHNFASDISKAGTINISGILARYLTFRDFQLIAVTTFDGFHRVIERNSALSNLFEKVEVAEISELETLTLLENYVPFFETKHKRFISFRSLREILKLSTRYLADRPFPEKALRLLDETMSYLTLYAKDRVLQARHIRKVVAEKIEIPLESLEVKEKEILLNLETLIHQRLINQEEAVTEVSSALRRARAEVNLKSGPIGCFLFLGPTGVGKTETAKALAAFYFGKEERMLRFDMSEFQNVEDIKRLIGSWEEQGLLTTAVKEKPFSLLLLDEIEKAHPNVLNLFLQVLDEGWLTDGIGRRVDFKNTIIIATSNAGAEVIRQSIKENRPFALVKDNLLDYLLTKEIFRPEFINRFDAVVAFKPLTKENLFDIAGLAMKKLAKNLEDKGVKFEITKDLKERIVELSYNPAFGAREMKRVIQDTIENALAKALLAGELRRGNSVEIDPENFKLIIQ